jgi:hypothetical protein
VGKIGKRSSENRSLLYRLTSLTGLEQKVMSVYLVADDLFNDELSTAS